MFKNVLYFEPRINSQTDADKVPNEFSNIPGWPNPKKNSHQIYANNITLNLRQNSVDLTKVGQTPILSDFLTTYEKRVLATRLNYNK